MFRNLKDPVSPGGYTGASKGDCLQYPPSSGPPSPYPKRGQANPVIAQASCAPFAMPHLLSSSVHGLLAGRLTLGQSRGVTPDFHVTLPQYLSQSP